MTRMSLPLGLIVNPAARRVRRRYLAADRFWERELPPAAVFTTHTPKELDEAVATIRARGSRIVACLGGDGTLHHTLTSVLRHFDTDDLPLLLPLAGGTLNGLARAFGTGGAPDALLHAVLAGIEHGPPAFRTRHPLRIEERGLETARFGFTFAAGLPARAARLYYQRAEPGLRDAVRVSLLAASSAFFNGRFYAPTGLAARIEADPPEAPHTIVAGTVVRPFLWFTPFGPAPPDNGTFHVATATMTPAEVAPRLWRIFRGRCTHPGLRLAQARTADVLARDGYVVDGEIHAPAGEADLRLTLGPAVRFLDPTQRREPAGTVRTPSR